MLFIHHKLPAVSPKWLSKDKTYEVITRMMFLFELHLKIPNKISDNARNF